MASVDDPEFVRLPDRSFEASYFKGILNTGLMMFMVVVLGVWVIGFGLGCPALLGRAQAMGATQGQGLLRGLAVHRPAAPAAAH